MIISYSKKFVYLRTIKVASTSLEIYLSQFCNRNDTLSPLYDEEEKLKTKLKLPNKRNYQLKKFAVVDKPLVIATHPKIQSGLYHCSRFLLFAVLIVPAQHLP